MTTERKKGAKGVPRTELVAVRFDPEAKYMMELAAKVQRRSTANYVEWAVEESFKTVVVYEDEESGKKTVADLRRELWDPIESDRFCILASWFPNLIDHDEMLVWKLIQAVWSTVLPAQDTFGPTKGFHIGLERLEFVRKHWEFLKHAAYEGIPASAVVETINQVSGD